MARNTTLTCDYCTDTTETQEDDLVEWYCVDFYDTMREEQRELDFCSAECVVSYFS
jgi:glutaredoxin